MFVRVWTVPRILYLSRGRRAKDWYIDKAHTALDIFRFAAFFVIRINFLLQELISLFHALIESIKIYLLG